MGRKLAQVVALRRHLVQSSARKCATHSRQEAPCTKPTPACTTILARRMMSKQPPQVNISKATLHAHAHPFLVSGAGNNLCANAHTNAHSKTRAHAQGHNSV